jgi:hypothetical protein
LYQKARDVLLPVFNLAPVDFEVAATYSCLALYLIASGDITRAVYFLQNAHTFLENPNRLGLFRERILDFMIRNCLKTIEWNENLCECLRQIHMFVDPNPDVSEPGKIDLIISHVTYIFEGPLKHEPNPDPVFRLYFYILAHGAKLQLMKSNDTHISLLLPVADTLTELCMSPLLPLCNPMVSIAIVTAASVHYTALIQNRNIDAAKKLKQDVKNYYKLYECNKVLLQRYMNRIYDFEQFIAIYS